MTGDFCLRLRENAPLEEQARLAAKKADHDHCAEKFWQCNLSDQSYAVSARALFALRFFLDRIFGWDQEPAGGKPKYFAERLTREDRERSTVPAGTPERFFRMVYSFENETLLEVINRTAHGALLTALAETPQVYRFYLAVYVRELSWVTLAYVR